MWRGLWPLREPTSGFWFVDPAILPTLKGSLGRPMWAILLILIHCGLLCLDAMR